MPSIVTIECGEGRVGVRRPVDPWRSALETITGEEAPDDPKVDQASCYEVSELASLRNMPA